MKGAILVLLFALAPLAGRAEMFGKDYAPCGDQPNTLAIVDCINGHAQAWDRRLNAAYKALGEAADPGQRDPLKAAQRLWVQYRNANCAFYAAHEGSIRQVLAAECLRSMTQDRALEMEQAAKP